MACDPDQAVAALKMLFDNYNEAETYIRQAFCVPLEKQRMPVCIACAEYAHAHDECELRGYVYRDSSISWRPDQEGWDDIGENGALCCGYCGDIREDHIRWVPYPGWSEGDPLPAEDFKP